MSDATFYKWRSKFGGMDVSMMARMKELEEENRRLKKMYAEERLKAEVLNEAITKSGKAISSEEDGSTGNGAVWHERSPGLSHFFDQRDLLSVPGQALR